MIFFTRENLFACLGAVVALAFVGASVVFVRAAENPHADARQNPAQQLGGAVVSPKNGHGELAVAVEKTQQFSVGTVTPVQLIADSTLLHDSVECVNTTANPVYVVESADTAVTNGRGPYCTTCNAGTTFQTPARVVFALATGGTATLQCGFVFGGTHSGGGGGSAAGVPASGGTFTGDVRFPAGTMCSDVPVQVGETSSGFGNLDTTNHRLAGCVNGILAMRLDDAPATTVDSKGNIVVGQGSGLVLNTNTGTVGGFNNAFVGAESGSKVTTGAQNTYVGSRAGHENVTASQQTFLGQGAGYFDVAADDLMVGFHAGLDLTNGGTNTCVGTQSCEGHTTGSVGDSTAANVTALGFQAARVVTSASQDVIIGTSAGDAVTTSTGLVCIGFNTCGAITTVGSNTIVGSNSFTTATTAGTQNVSVGTNTLQSTTSSENVAVGYASLISLSSGADNTAVGWQAGFSGTALTTGSNNTFVGSAAQVNANNASNRTVVGQGAVGTTNNAVQLGNTSTLDLFLGSVLHYHGVAPSSVTSGSCTSESLRAGGTEAKGEITATCTSQTWIVSFTTTYGAAPVCTVTAMNAAATAGAATFAYTTSTTALTATVTTATTAGIWAYHCEE